LAAPRPADAASDAELLARFLARRDEAAFAAIVARHGPMVLRVCRRILADAHAAEDCFQATFLVLARKAASVRRRESLAAWLHGVAARVSRKARDAGRRRAKAPPTRGPARWTG
jgi:RNA polymerase sigma-70 factor (ECF subfamily)